MHVLIHANPRISWQVSYSKAFLNGLNAQAIDASITHNPKAKDEHMVVLGPHWAKKHHPDCLYVDRAYWGDPHAVSIHQLRDGEKVFDWSNKPQRARPVLKPMKRGHRTLALCDFGQYLDIDGATIRRHPSEHKSKESLQSCLNRHDVAIGGKSTALVDAAINGLVVKTLSDNSPVSFISGQQNPDRAHWINCLAWHNWTLKEINEGMIWHWLKF